MFVSAMNTGPSGCLWGNVLPDMTGPEVHHEERGDACPAYMSWWSTVDSLNSGEPLEIIVNRCKTSDGVVKGPQVGCFPE